MKLDLLRYRAASALVLAFSAIALAACESEASADDQTFVEVDQVAQWIVDHECDSRGAQEGFPGYGGEGMGQIAQVTFVCDNGRTFDIRLQDDGTYDFTEQ
jgi:hypothetical protein